MHTYTRRLLAATETAVRIGDFYRAGALYSMLSAFAAGHHDTDAVVDFVSCLSTREQGRLFAETPPSPFRELSLGARS